MFMQSYKKSELNASRSALFLLCNVPYCAVPGRSSGNIPIKKGMIVGLIHYLCFNNVHNYRIAYNNE